MVICDTCQPPLSEVHRLSGCLFLTHLRHEIVCKSSVSAHAAAPHRCGADRRHLVAITCHLESAGGPPQRNLCWQDPELDLSYC